MECKGPNQAVLAMTPYDAQNRGWRFAMVKRFGNYNEHLVPNNLLNIQMSMSLL